MRTTALLLAALTFSFGAQAADGAPKKGPGCLLPNADTSVYGIVLGDGKATRKVLSGQKFGAPHDPQTDFPWYAFASRDGKQVMRLRHHAGDVVDSYMEIEVKRGKDDKAVPVAARSFVSGKGARLGMTRTQVVALFGPCFTATRDDRTEIIRYEILDESAKPAAAVLRRANMPQYYAEYEFQNGRLVRFTFGHEPV